LGRSIRHGVVDALTPPHGMSWMPACHSIAKLSSWRWPPAKPAERPSALLPRPCHHAITIKQHERWSVQLITCLHPASTHARNSTGMLGLGSRKQGLGRCRRLVLCMEGCVSYIIKL
jgi:hypothetical protein